MCDGRQQCVEEIWRLCGGRYDCIKTAWAAFEAQATSAGKSAAAGGKSAASAATAGEWAAR